MKPRFNLVERLSVAALVVLVDPQAFGLPETLQAPSGLVYGPIVVVALGLLVDRRRLARALRAAADVVDDDGSERITLVE
jgi:hypothetical protein